MAVLLNQQVNMNLIKKSAGESLFISICALPGDLEITFLKGKSQKQSVNKQIGEIKQIFLFGG